MEIFLKIQKINRYGQVQMRVVACKIIKQEDTQSHHE
jgi:hypothetical protein